MRRSSWVKAAIWSGAGLAALLAAAAFGFRDNLFRHAMDPRAPFQTLHRPDAPDYTAAASWVARAENPTPGRPAIFFVHPTTYWGGQAWNAAIDDAEPAERLEQVALPNYAGAFAALGDLWAPRYRQASLYASLTHRFDARLARALAYGDVSRAFATFLADAPPDSPLLLVGVEQGGLHVLGVLQDMLAAEPLRRRLVAAYVIDQAVPLDLFDQGLRHLAPCLQPEDTGCIVSWGGVEESRAAMLEDFRRRSMVWMGEGRLESTDGRALLCVNPLSGSAAEDYIPARNNHGAVQAAGLALGVEPAPLPGQTSAQCSDGVLLVDRPESPSLRPGWRWGDRFKPRTAFLFYMDARRDAERRIAAYQGAAAVEAAIPEAPPEPEETEEAALPALPVVEVEHAPIHKVDD